MANDVVVTIDIDRIGTVTSKLIPGSVSESKAASWDPTQIRGRSLPIYGYSSSEARSLDLSILLIASSYSGGGDSEYSTGRDVWEAATKLKAACYPHYSSVIKPPPVCSVTVGSFIEMPTCLMQNVSLTWGDAYDVDDYPVKCEVSLSFIEVQVVPSMDTEVLQRGY